MNLTIAIDFDDTLTADPLLWRKFITLAKLMRHRIVCITARRDTDENNEIISEWMQEHDIHIPVYFTSLSSKTEYAKKIGLKVDIWIDDDPKRCSMGH